jgi:hypothetical protein
MAFCLAFAVSFALASPATLAAGTWTLVPSAGNYGDQLLAVSGVPSDAWAVGNSYNQTKGSFPALAEHWNGSTWTKIPALSPGSDVQLNGVARVATNDVWAVGFFNNSGWYRNETLAEHWNGTSWSQVPTPSPLKGGQNDLWGVYAAASNNVWAVGDTYPSTQQTLIEHWDGSSWTVVASPNLTNDDALHAITGRGPNDIWAAGTATYDSTDSTVPLVEHWNGSGWSIVSAPGVSQSDYVRNISIDSTGDAWLVGDATGPAPNYTDSPLVEQWSGSSWKAVSSPNLGAISGIASVSKNDAWIAGVHGYPGGLGGTLIEHWNGSTWSAVTSPNAVAPSGTNFDSLNAVSQLGSSTELFAVGSWQGNNGGGPLVLENASG